MAKFSTGTTTSLTPQERLREELAGKAAAGDGQSQSISDALATAGIPEGDVSVATADAGEAAVPQDQTLGEVAPQSATTSFLGSEQERTLQARDAVIHTPETTEEAAEYENLRKQAEDSTLPIAVREEALRKLKENADVRLDRFTKEQERKKQQTQLTPFRETRKEQFEARLLSEQQRIAGMKNLNFETINASETASHLFGARDGLYQVMSQNNPSSVVANQYKKDQEFNNSMDFYEKSSGVKQPDIHANTAAVVWAKAAQTGVYARFNEDLGEVEDVDIDSVDADDDLFADDDIVGRSTTDKSETSVAKNYPKLRDVYTIMGREGRAAANRQGYDYGVTDIELGQQLFKDGQEQGWAQVILAKAPGSNLPAEPRVQFDKEFAYALAPAGKILLPDLLKEAPATPAVGVGYESSLGRFIREEKRGSVKKGAQIISTTSKKAATALGRVPFKTYAAELGFVQTLMHIASNGDLENGLLKENSLDPNVKQIVPAATGVATKARSTLSLDKGEAKAVAQNSSRIQRSLTMLGAKLGQNVFPRFSIGNNSERKYNTTRDANVTMFKEQRHTLRNGAPAQVYNSGDLKIPGSDQALFSFIKETKGAKKAEANFLFTIGSVLALDPSGQGDPRVIMRMAQDNMTTWAGRGKVLADAYLGDFQGTPAEKLKALINARMTGTNVANPADVLQNPTVAAEVEKIIGEGDDGDTGYRFTALVDAYLYTLAKETGTPFPAISVGQLDLTAAGLTFMAKDAGSQNLLRSMGLIISVDTATGENIVNYEGPRDIYKDHTLTQMDEVYRGHNKMDRGVKMKTLFKNQILGNNGSTFIKNWGKPPMMITPFGKHHATHQGTVITFLGKSASKEFLAEAKKIYGITDENSVAFQELVEDLAEIHSKSLKKLFDMDTTYAVAAANTLFAIGGESFSHPGLDDETMVYGMDKHEFIDTGQQINDIDVPVYTGEKRYDPLARATSKTMEFVNDKGEITSRSFTPDYMTAGKNTPLAAIGHRRESSALDEVTLAVAEGKPLTPFMANMYDSLSFDPTSALDVWLGLNVTGHQKAFDWNPVESIQEAIVKQEKKTREYLASKDIVNMSYPDGDDGALGYALDKEYVSLINQLSNSKKYKDDYVLKLRHKKKDFEKVAKLTKWSPPEVVDDPNQGNVSKERNGIRKVPAESFRTFDTMSGKDAVMLFNAWKKISEFNNTITGWALDEKKDTKRLKAKQAVDARKGKISYWAKPISH